MSLKFYWSKNRAGLMPRFLSKRFGIGMIYIKGVNKPKRLEKWR
jgi:hypothetical protein